MLSPLKYVANKKINSFSINSVPEVQFATRHHFPPKTSWWMPSENYFSSFSF